MDRPYRGIERIATNSWLAAISMLTEVAGFIYLFYTLTFNQGRPTPALFWFVLTCTLVLFGFTCYSLYKITSINKGLIFAILKWHEVNHLYRNSLASSIIHQNPTSPVRDFVLAQKTVLHSVCQKISSIYTQLIGVPCLVTVKLCVPDNKCKAFVRSDLHTERDRCGESRFVIDADKNTAFVEARKQQNKNGIFRFYSPDLRKLYEGGHYQNERDNWSDLYQSTIVVPLRYQDSERSPSMIDELGFLCVDTQSRNRLNDTFHVQMLAAFADQMYNFITLSRAAFIGSDPTVSAEIGDSVYRTKEIK